MEFLFGCGMRLGDDSHQGPKLLKTSSLQCLGRLEASRFRVCGSLRGWCQEER